MARRRPELPQPEPPRADGAAAGASAALRACSAAASTSCFRIRPPTPVPDRVVRSTLCSAASLRTRGVTYGDPSPPAAGAAVGAAAVGAAAMGAGGVVAGAGGGADGASCLAFSSDCASAVARVAASASSGVSALAAASSGLIAGVVPAGCAAGSADAPSAAPMTASSVPTSTVSSSATLISSSVPEAGDGISVSTLSVEISRSGSSVWTWSPTCLSQRVTVPSVTLSPSAGRVTDVPPALPPVGCAGCAASCGFPVPAGLPARWPPSGLVPLPAARLPFRRSRHPAARHRPRSVPR